MRRIHARTDDAFILRALRPGRTFSLQRSVRLSVGVDSTLYALMIDYASLARRMTQSNVIYVTSCVVLTSNNKILYIITVQDGRLVRVFCELETFCILHDLDHSFIDAKTLCSSDTAVGTSRFLAKMVTTYQEVLAVQY